MMRLGVLLFLATAFACPAIADDAPVQYLHLDNSGAYSVSPVELHWKTPAGKTYRKKFNVNMSSKKGFCLDIEKLGLVEEGSEVWLKAYIVLGEIKTCRDSNKKRIYSVNGEGGYWEMSGQTLTNNRCNGTVMWSWGNDVGNSGKCPYCTNGGKGGGCY